MIRPLCTALVLSLLLACASQTRIAEPIRAAVAAEHAGRTVQLRQSCYYGDLYDENEKWLLSPHPFKETYHIVNLDGEPIHPGGQRGIAPAGSRFTIHKIEFPDHYAVSMRMLTTPRYNPWIYLTPVEGSPLPTDRKAYILLLPMDMETREQVEAAIAEVLADDGAVSAWLTERSPTIQVAIKHKDAIPEMTEEELTAALGPPHRWFNDTRDGKSARVAWYPSREAWLVDGKVAEVKEARAVKQRGPEPAPDDPAESDSNTAEERGTEKEPSPVPVSSKDSETDEPTRSPAAPDA